VRVQSPVEPHLVLDFSHPAIFVRFHRRIEAVG
jgi:hypothetical protein